jgi:putative tryptophan/tyrosine transport system substrate-binding protein
LTDKNAILHLWWGSMRRREFIWLVGDAAAAWPLPARAQQRKIPIVGFLGATTPSTAPDRTGAFVQRLSELGWNDGSTVKIAYRWAEASEERAAQIAAEFARLNVDVIVTSGVPEIRAAKRVTATIPIVFGVAADPVGTGLVASLAQPGGNVTGLSNQSAEISGQTTRAVARTCACTSPFGDNRQCQQSRRRAGTAGD